MRDYNNKIMKLAEIHFNDVNDNDVITFNDEDISHNGIEIRSWYYLYDQDGKLKDLKDGKLLPVSFVSFSRPTKKKE